MHRSTADAHRPTAAPSTSGVDLDPGQIAVIADRIGFRFDRIVAVPTDSDTPMLIGFAGAHRVAIDAKEFATA